MLLELKCKIGSLAAEAKFTRNIERKEKGHARYLNKKYGQKDIRMIRAVSLRLHRIGSVRKEARNAQLAYAFLRDKPYLLTERSLKLNPQEKPINKVHWDEVEKIALRFSLDDDPRVVKQRFAEWKDAKPTLEMIKTWEYDDIATAEKLETKRRNARDARGKIEAGRRAM